MRFIVAGVSIAALVTVVACSRQPAPAPATEAAVEAVPGVAWSRVAVADMSESQQAQQERAVAAAQALGGRLLGELTTALDERGPDGAIEVCSIRAPEIAAAVSNEFGVLVGRTSFRLRNLSNQPPEWGEEVVAERVAEPTWLAGPHGELGGMLPIRLRAECEMCHGRPEQIADEVQTKVAEMYPHDLATGFQEGDLRGWIWVEVGT